jgi:hypothetical protein
MTQLVLLDVGHAVTYTGRNPSTLRTWRQRYGLTRYGTGRVTLFALHELAAVLAALDEENDTRRH